MQAGRTGFVTHLDVRAVLRHEGVEGAALGGTAVRRSEDSRLHTTFAQRAELLTEDGDASELDERAQQVHAVRTREFVCDLAGHIRLTLGVGEQCNLG